MHNMYIQSLQAAHWISLMLKKPQNFYHKSENKHVEMLFNNSIPKKQEETNINFWGLNWEILKHN